jgi:hypothetical protein
LAKRKKREAALTNGKPKPDNLESPGDTTETFFETKPTCKLPQHPIARADETLHGMPVGAPAVFDCRNEEGPDGLPSGWKPNLSVSEVPYAKNGSLLIASGPPGQGLPRGATASSKASEGPLCRTTDSSSTEKTKEFFPPQMGPATQMVSHRDILEDTWENPPEEAPAQKPEGQNPKRTIFGIPVFWNR